MHGQLINPGAPFCIAVAQHKYLGAEKGLQSAIEGGCTHWYIDGSLPGESVEDWTDARITRLQEKIAVSGVQPLLHSNFKAPLGSDVGAFRAAAVKYVEKEIDIASRLGAPLIIHGGCLIGPQRVPEAKKVALEHYLKSVQKLARYAEGKGTDIYVESLSNYVNYRIFTDEAQFARVFEHLQAHRNVYCLLDAGHAHIDSGLPAQVVRTYHALIKGISFSNNPAVHDTGNCDCADVVKAIADTHWKGLVGFDTGHQTARAALAELALMYRKALSTPITDA
ncbi:Sugar phosphate isomerase/epimerase [Pseudomonas antarctica]|uniref:Endonuclease 4 n=1 Tax=Pseudomonas antarctica TaxID=219572 RepID=A0A1H0BNG5_9PSED|nr:TIM barrel protein [Pseudomonas antarctica]KAF2406554.1 endonuclease 4 [Pseudomonas antarctica]SDN47105.1 Sugar phosphate isomerase/epimerase [Pseudomonas antarctica]